MNKGKISVIGFGRFGKTLARLLQDDFEVTVFDRSPNAFKNTRGLKVRRARSVSDALRNSTVFYAVPITKFEKIVRSHSGKFRPDHLLIDVLSIKLHPEQVLRKYASGENGPRALLTHPMFGPDSSKGGFAGLRMVMNRMTATAREYEFWKNAFRGQGLKIIELPSRSHDQLAARSQGVVHFVGRLLKEFGFAPTAIDTLGAQKLHELQNQVASDTWELFSGLQNFNPYTRQMRVRLGKAYDKLYDRLLPRRVARGKTIFGVQGGRGSFNEQAAREYIRLNRINDAEIKYLFTTERVLRHLHEGRIDFGQFAIQNAVGGMVAESITAMTRYKCRIVAEFPILIRHFLMKRKDNPAKIPSRIMAHDQVFRQCTGNLKKKYPKARLVVGKGDLQDTARAAQALAQGRVPKSTFILGPKILSEIYGLEITDQNLQDDKNNMTTFLMVRR